MKKATYVLLFTLFLVACDTAEKEAKQEAEAKAAAAELNPTLLVAVGKVEPAQEIVGLSAPSGGIITSVLHKDGDSVRAGELLVQLDDAVEQNRINEIQQQLNSQRTQISIDESGSKEIQIKLANKKDQLVKMKRLMDNGAATRQEYDDLATETAVLEVDLKQAESRIQLARNRMTELAAQLETARTEASKKQFRAPSDGLLLKMSVNKGGAISQFNAYADFAPGGSLIVRAEVDEMFNAKVKTGQQVDIILPGSDSVIATGEVISVAPYLKKKSLFSEKANDQEDRRVRELRIALKQSGNLIINAKVECKIKL